MPRQMAKEEFRAALVSAIDEYMKASIEKDAAATKIRRLLPTSDLVHQLDHPPVLCDGCGNPGAYYTGEGKPMLCGDCARKQREADEQARIDAAVAQRLAQAGGER